MTTWGPGSVVQRRRVRFGAVSWAVLSQVLRELGWRWWLLEEEDTDPGAGAATFGFVFQDGWLELDDGLYDRGGTKLGEARAEGLARHLAVAQGRVVVLRDEEVVLRPRNGALATSLRIVDRACAPDGTERLTVRAEVDEDYDLDADWVADESATAIALDLWEDEPLPPGGALPPGADFATRRGHLRPTLEVAPPVTGPPAVFSGASWRFPLDAAGRCALERALRRAGALDEDQPPPDLGRWTDRAVRRAGLVAVPEPGTPNHEAFCAVLDALTAGDRGAPGRDGRVAGWKLRTPGRWLLGAHEVARIAAAAGVPEALRLRGEEQPWTVEVPLSRPGAQT